ncbi:MAG: YfbM family protein, partial [Planctomycetales bacterium]
RVSSSRLQELLADPARIQDELYPEHYPANLEQRGCNVEKTWNAIEFILDRLAETDGIPEILPLTEGAETGCVLHYGPVWFRTASEVAEIASVLKTLSRDDFRKGFLPDLMSEHHVYPGDWDEEDQEWLFNYVWSHFENMVEFYQAAAEDGDAVLLHLG